MVRAPDQIESDAVLVLARELIARESITPADAGCLDLIGERLSAAGMEIERLDDGDVSNLLARHGSGSPHLMLVGHTDVVPTGPLEKWTSHPFEPQVRDGFLYGRGAADMKGSVAAFVVAIEQYLSQNPDHPGTLSLVLTSDEEGPARHGVRSVVEVLSERGQLPDACLVGEPSSREQLGDNIRIGRRGSVQARLVVHGRQGHTAYSESGDNPVHRAAPVIAALAGMAFDDSDEYFPPTRLQISNVHAGTGADNVTPGELELMFNLRNNPNSPPEQLERRIRDVIRELDPGDWSLDWRISGEPFGPATGPLPEIVATTCRSRLGIEPVADTGGGTSDGRFFGPRGIPVVELGPVNRSIHQVDERVRVADLESLPGLYGDIMSAMLAGSV